MQRKKVMVFCDYYLPGFKSGGGMWTVVNLVDRFCDRFDFYIVARNHDGKADRKPYEDVVTGEWNSVGNAKVFYVDWRRLTVSFFGGLIDEIKPDLVFLNSVFSRPSITFLRTRKKRRYSQIPVIVSPCGELAGATLKLKATKKTLFLKYAKLARLYRDVIWRASFELDAQEIRDAIGSDVEVMCAPDLPPKTILADFDILKKPAKLPGAVHFVFVSRLVRKKNLHYLLERLSFITEGEIVLDAVGPIEDKEYWKECEAAAKPARECQFQRLGTDALSRHSRSDERCPLFCLTDADGEFRIRVPGSFGLRMSVVDKR
jgi:glycosyltransferase involved in cell wall biosynthesis